MALDGWYVAGQRVKIRQRFKKLYRTQVREDTYGTAESVFVVQGYYPSLVILGEESPPHYCVNPENKDLSTTMIEEEHLVEAE